MKKTLLSCAAVLCALLTTPAAQAQTNEPPRVKLEAAATNEPPKVKLEDVPVPAARKVSGRVVTSDALPALTVKVDKAFKYVGSHTFILYDVARAEQHFFVDAGADGRIRRLYWVQFENYIPGNTFKYDYNDVKETVTLGGFKFHTDARVINLPAVKGQHPDSDGSRAQAFLEGKGLRVAGDDIVLRRFVHLADEARRHELLIIYLEDLSGTGLTAADLSPQGRAAAQWPELSTKLRERALKGIKVSKR